MRPPPPNRDYTDDGYFCYREPISISETFYAWRQNKVMGQLNDQTSAGRRSTSPRIHMRGNPIRYGRYATSIQLSVWNRRGVPGPRGITLISKIRHSSNGCTKP